MPNFLQSVDARTSLAGANQFEVLLFSLRRDQSSDRDEVLAINVFKVREVMHAPEITRAPDAALPPKILIVTEYNKNVQAFLVDAVECIERLAWDNVKDPPGLMTSGHGGLVTAGTELKDGRLMQLIDVEKVLAESAGLYANENTFAGINTLEGGQGVTLIIFADDSAVARTQVSRTLATLGLRSTAFRNGAKAWERLSALAAQVGETDGRITDLVSMVITDVEMPEMDGYVLTHNIKADPRLGELPVIMHSFLSANQGLGETVCADAYVPKFIPQKLAAAIEKMLEKRVPSE
jgi:two-component system chemotaxis response regulator CheV